MPVEARTPECHPDRDHCARGMCKPCYDERWRRRRRKLQRQANRRPCEVCGTMFEPLYDQTRYCGDGCKAFAYIMAERERNGSAALQEEDLFCTRDPKLAESYAESCRRRGARKVHPQTSPVTIDPPYYSPWRRSCGLYVVRSRWPDEQQLNTQQHEGAA